MRWIIDRLEDALAMCEDENGEITPFPVKKFRLRPGKAIFSVRRTEASSSLPRRQRTGAGK